MGKPAAPRLHDLIETEWQRPVPPAVAQLAERLARRATNSAAVLYYGSTLRDDTLEGVLDFYILLDSVRAWPGSAAARLGNRLLPPNVGYFEGTQGGHTLRAKYAVMSLAQFRRGIAFGSLDTTLWARFCQPCACVWERTPADRAAALDLVAHATGTAARWAAALGPARGVAGDYWRALFSHTYDAELRVEKARRGTDIVARDPDRYARLLPAAWRADGVGFEAAGDRLAPRLTPRERSALARRWRRRARLGKLLNLARLAKALFTFERAAEYAAWKIERHSGVRIELSDWQRRHPLLAAPGLYRRLRRLGVLR